MKNLLLNQLTSDENAGVKELVPEILDNENISFLTNKDDIKWRSIKSGNNTNVRLDESGNIIIDSSCDSFANTPLHFEGERIGIGRKPLYNYKIDVEVPENTQMTALHIGDGTFGFSLGNATNEGFLPQIIGIGSDAQDAGLYFLGKVSSDDSNIPAIVFDGRNNDNSPLENRPVIGFSNGSYDEQLFLIKANGDANLEGVLSVKDVLYQKDAKILSLQAKLDNLEQRISKLELNSQ